MRPESIRDIFTSMLKRISFGPKIRAGMAVYIWPRVVGEEVAASTQAVSIQNGTLFVKTENASLAREMITWKKTQLQGFRKLLGPGIVKEIRVTIGSIERERENSFFPEEKEVKRDVSASAEDPVARLRMAQEKLKKTRIKKGWSTCPSCQRLYPPPKQEACFYCRFRRREEQVKEIMKHLNACPWMSWEKWDDRGWSYENFCEAKGNLLSRFRDGIYLWQKKAHLSEQEIKEIKDLLMKYILLLKGEPVDEWPEDICRALLGPEKYGEIFKTSQKRRKTTNE